MYNIITNKDEFIVAEFMGKSLGNCTHHYKADDGKCVVMCTDEYGNPYEAEVKEMVINLVNSQTIYRVK